MHCRKNKEVGGEKNTVYVFLFFPALYFLVSSVTGAFRSVFIPESYSRLRRCRRFYILVPNFPSKNIHS